jgi:hypothetical protein
MRTKVTLILILLNAGLFAYIYYARREWDSKLTDTNLVLGPETSNIRSLEISTAASANPIKIERSPDDSWTLTQPLQWPANGFAVTRIISELQQLHPYATFTVTELGNTGQTLADFGLEKPPLTLTFTPAPASPGAPAPKSIVLKIGDPTKVGNRLYVLSPDGKSVHVVNRSLAESLALRLEDLRADTLFTIPVFEVRSFRLQPPAPAASIRIANDNNRWLFESPFKANNVRANKAATVIAINGLRTLRVKAFLNPGSIDNARTGLGSPELQISLNGNNRHETLLLGNQVAPTEMKPAATEPTPDPSKTAPSPTVEYYAQMEDKAPIFTVSFPTQLLETLRNAQESLRDTHVIDVEPSTVTSITLSAPNQPQVTLQRLESSSPNPATASWQVVRHNGERGPQTFPADRELVERLLQNLVQLTAERFANDAPSAAELEDYGFSRPAREIALSRPQAGGIGAVTTLQIGASSGTDPQTYAKLVSQNYVYRVANTILRDTPVSVLSYRDRVIRELAAGAQIVGLKLIDLTSNNILLDTTLPFTEVADKDASLTPSRRQAVETLATQLRTLRAKSFLSEEFSRTIAVNGEDRPWRYRLDTTLSLVGGAAAQTTVSALYFSERVGGSIQYAGSPDLSLVFEAEQSLLDAFFAVVYGPKDPGPTTPPAETPARAATPPIATPSAPAAP